MVVLSTGYATTGTSYISIGQKLLASSQKIVSSLGQISYDLIKCGEPIKFAFDEHMVVIEVGDKKRFAKGFLLPFGSEPYSITITSYKIGTLTDPAILYPEVQILDKDYNVIRTLPFTDFVFRSSMSGDGLNAVLFVNNDARGERFLLITNRSINEADLIESQSNITGSMLVMVPVGTGFVMWNIPSGKNTPPIKIKVSPIGQMEVLCQEYRLQKVGQ
jgi:hypothetical protein